MQKPARKGFNSQGSILANDGIKLHWYSRREEQAKFQIIGIHGLGEHAGRYAWFADQIAANGGTCSFLDLRGHGKSQGKRGHSPNWKQLLEDVELFVASQRNVKLPGFFFGHSMGGGLALSYALQLSRSQVGRDTFKGFIAASPLLKLSFTPPTWKLFLARQLVQIWPSFSLNRDIDPGKLTRDEKIKAAYLSDPLNHELVSAALTLGFLQAGQESLSGASELRIPTLILHGEADQVTDLQASREFANTAGDYAEFKNFPNCRHELLNELDKEQVVHCIDSWISDCIKLQPVR